MKGRRVLPVALLAADLLVGVSGAYGSAASAGTPALRAALAVPAATTPAADHNDQDVMFARMMIPHHRQAVEMGRLAEDRAADARVARLARRIEAAQAPEIRTMSGWLTAWGEPLPGENRAPAHHAMPGMMSPEDMRRLEGLSGRAFDRAFLTMMIRHHEGAVAMARDELRTGVYEPARRMAASIVSSQSAEIREMKSLLG
ncbi:DUF305 domain-containing protein [Microbispora sp. NEAU-D428]|uniref:DUF305 domain-containing protein n=1 Tax=Microbispora sitophila TaxID=2771537 RepID=UPI001865E740|nr:DUF305 domain-containing protein [Microbispora sitophila]MBE3013958.1 DUF305 domain-containing protein [Microbispora sitophila]